jgi:hypothetical protein
MTTSNTPPAMTAELLRLADTELSLRSRLGYVALLLAALMMTSVVGSLWLTEPSLPRRAHAGFALMTVIGISWVVFAIRVLTHRRVLLARHGIVAGRMAVTFTSVFVLGALVAIFAAGGAAAYAATATGVVMLGAAIVLLRRAQQTFARLTERRDVLARELGRTGR